MSAAFAATDEDDRDTAARFADERTAPEAEQRSEILVVGAGLAGICAGIKLREAGFTDFAILERADDLGGTWRQNTYPGLTVDVLSLAYSFSFEQKPDWDGMWTPQPELLEYARHCATKYDILSHIQFGQEVVGSTYDAEDNVWLTELADGSTYVSRYVLNASGFLSTANWPAIEGIEAFHGTKVHTSEWPDDFDVAGKRVAVIGTGATAIQIAPELAPQAEQLHVFQRTPIWVAPKPRWHFSKTLQRVFKYVPGLQRVCRWAIQGAYDVLFWRIYTHFGQVKPMIRLFERLCRRNMKSVEDPAVRAALTPAYDFGCKRPSFSSTYFPMFNRSNVELVTSPITRITESGIVTADGVERPLDALICATGYKPFARDSLPTYPVRGTGGLELRTYWDEHRYQAYRGFAVNGFPNYFLIFGPYSAITGSVIALIENAVRNTVTCLTVARQRGCDRIEVDARAQRLDFEENIRKSRGSIHFAGNCAGSNSYYYDRHGDTPLFRQTSHAKEWWFSRTKAKNMSAFHVTRHQGPGASAAAGPMRTTAEDS